MSIDLDRLTSLNIDGKCSSPTEDLGECKHNIQVEYKDTGVEDLGISSGRDIFLLLSQLINTNVLSDEDLKAINWKHFQPQREIIIKDVIKSGNVDQVDALIKSKDIPVEYPSEFLKLAIEQGNKDVVHIFFKNGFDPNYVEYYNAAINTKNIDIVRLVIFNPVEVRKVLKGMLENALQDISTFDGTVFSFLTKTYGDQNIFSPEIVDLLCSDDVFFDLVKFVEDNTKTVISEDVRRRWLFPVPGVKFSTFWVGGNEGEKVLYLARSNSEGKIKNHKTTLMFCNQLLGVGISNVTLNG